MAVVAVVTSSPPDVEGGHLVVARSLVQALTGAGHLAQLIVTPDYGFGRLTASYLAALKADVSQVDGRPTDQVISLRYPSYAVRHRAHVCWLNHAMREYYDLWPQFSEGLSPGNRIKEGARRALLRVVDRHLLKQHVTRVVAQSQTVADRAAHDFGIHADVLYPPPPPRPYRHDAYGDYIFTVSRLHPLKRVDLLIRALSEPPAKRVKAVIAGDGESRRDLEQLAATLGVSDRVTWLGAVDDPVVVDHFARCRAVCFVPLAEDYGFVTAEAFASGKCVVTCRDSGGPAELVRSDETGMICEPMSLSIAMAIGQLAKDVSLAERLGANAAAVADGMTWDAAVKRLVIV
jgi:glycosyltransferase involved in cell wall biosynthesis